MEKDSDNCPGLCPLQVTWVLEAETRVELYTSFPRFGWRPEEHWGLHCWREIRLTTQLREGAGRVWPVEIDGMEGKKSSDGAKVWHTLFPQPCLFSLRKRQ